MPDTEEPRADEQLNVETDGNGKDDELIKGPAIDLSELKKVDGLIGRRVLQNIGVLVRAMTVHPISEAQQELKLANFQTADEADEFVSAWNECITLGMDPTPIYYQMLARSAGIKQNFIMRVFDTLTHTTFTTNYQKGNKNDVKNRTNSPFST